MITLLHIKSFLGLEQQPFQAVRLNQIDAAPELALGAAVQDLAGLFLQIRLML